MLPSNLSYSPGTALTPQQEKIVELICKGLENKLIAHELKLADSTVKVHIRDAMRRYHVTNRVQLAMKWLRKQGRLIDGDR
jgi:DNA-binding NarL/FixJ family response regulator